MAVKAGPRHYIYSQKTSSCFILSELKRASWLLAEGVLQERRGLLVKWAELVWEGVGKQVGGSPIFLSYWFAPMMPKGWVQGAVWPGPCMLTSCPASGRVTQNAYKSSAQINPRSRMSELHNLQNGRKAFHLCIWWDESLFSLWPEDQLKSEWDAVYWVIRCALQVLMSASFLGALCLFSSVCVVCAISAFTLPIETKGRALQVSDVGL